MGIHNQETVLLNQTIVEQLTSGDRGLQKEAESGINDYVRMRVREDGFARSIIPPLTITAEEFDKQVDTEKPVKVLDKEPNSAGAYSIPFGTGPMAHYVKGPRYRIMFDRIATRRYTTDVNKLLTYDYDIRQVLNDLSIKDIGDQEDAKFIAACNQIVGTDPTIDGGTGEWEAQDINAELEARQNINVGPVSRTSLIRAQKGLPSTNRNLTASVGLINNITVLDFIGNLDRAAWGGDVAEETLIRGIGERTINGMVHKVTIKKALVPNDVMFMFAEPKFLGKFFIFKDITMSTKTENYILEFFGYEEVGAAIANEAALCKVHFTGTAMNWTNTSGFEAAD